MPFFSIIIPTYNRHDVLRRAINSVLAQDFEDFELLVVDDGSTDNTQELLASYTDPRIKYFYIENSGVSKARNTAIKKSVGKWICFLDSDDEWLIPKLSTQYEVIQSQPEISLVHGEEIWIRNGQRVNQMKKHQKFGGFIFEKCLPLCLISPSAVAIKRDVFDDVGLFKDDFVVCEDYDLWLRITHKYEVAFIEDPIIYKYGGHEDQLSRKFIAMDHWRIRSLDEVIPLINIDQKRLAISELLKKATILLKGYEKHGHNEKANQINEYIKKYKETSC